MSREYSNMRRGIAVLVALTAFIGFALWLLSYEEGAGTISFRISLGFVFAESILILIPYCRWYRSVSEEAAQMYSLAQMQAMGRKKALKMQGGLLFLSAAAGGAGAALVFIGILFAGISIIFSYSAILGELLGGNILVHLLTHRIFLPDRIIGKC